MLRWKYATTVVSLCIGGSAMPMSRSLLIVPAVLFVLAGCGSTGSAGSAASAASQVGAALASQASALQLTTTSAASTAAATTVLVKTDPKLGKLLTDPSGRTLYWYAKDTTGVSNCSGGCLAAWPPFVATGSLSLPSGTPGTLSAITRSDGSSQVAYDGMPLYYFAKDTAPGDTAGQAVGKTWYVVPPTAGPLAPPAA
ncbi:MAG TPA: hypothetical protein VIU62_15900 [Chloroflexota bacterium]